MKSYSADIRIFTTVYVKANSREEAKRLAAEKVKHMKPDNEEFFVDVFDDNDNDDD